MTYLFPCNPQQISKDSAYFTELDNDPDYWAEIKKNGWRMLIVKDGGMCFYTKKKTLIADSLPELREIFQTLPDLTILDGELIDKRTKKTKGTWYAFDILRLAGKMVYGLPLYQRRELLESVLPDVTGDHILLAQRYDLGKKLLFERSIEGEENEGIVIKKRDSIYPVSYNACQDNPYWIKVKRVDSDKLQAA